MLAKWNNKFNCLELFVELTLVGLPHTVKGRRLWNMAKNAKSTPKTKFHPCAVFSARALLKDGRHTKREFRALQQ